MLYLSLMRRIKSRLLRFSDRGQSMIETALILPLLLLLAFNAINFGYFIFAAVNLAASPRTAAQYSIIGASTPAQPATLPAAGPPGSSGTNKLTVSSLAFEDIQKVLIGSTNYSSARVGVCSQAVGVTGSGASQKSLCSQYGTGTQTWTPASDPEAPTFILNRVDMVYKVNPPIPPFKLPVPGFPGGLSLSLVPALSIHRQVSMRAMN